MNLGWIGRLVKYGRKILWIHVGLIVPILLGCTLQQVSGAAGGTWVQIDAAPKVQLPDLQSIKGTAIDPKDKRWAGWAAEIQSLEKKFPAYNLSNGAIVFIGSSSIKRWATLAQDFPDLPVINNGFGGSHIVDSVYFADRLVAPLAPRTVVMYAGSNDVNSTKTTKQVFADYVAFVNTVHASLPQTKIYFISIAPSPARWAVREKTMEANKLIEAYSATDPRLGFIDIYPYMLGEDGLPVRDLYGTDLLHMSPKGYALWTDIVGLHLGSRVGFVDRDGKQAGVADIRVTPFLQGMRLSGPQQIEVGVDTAPTGLLLQQVRVTLDGNEVYTGTQTNFKLLLNNGDLPEGVHTLQIIATAASKSVTRTYRFVVDNVQVYLSEKKDVVTGILPIKIQSGLPTESVANVIIDVNGTPVWQVKSLPTVAEINTKEFADGKVRLNTSVTTVAGVRTTSSIDLYFRNRWTFSDPIDPPMSVFGTLQEFSATVSSSSGWVYDNQSRDLFFNDKGRRVRTDNSTEELVWDPGNYYQAEVTLYIKDVKALEALRLSAAHDDNAASWVDLSFHIAAQDSSSSGWQRILVRVLVPSGQTTKLFRVMLLPSSVPPQDLQVGDVRFYGFL